MFVECNREVLLGKVIKRNRVGESQKKISDRPDLLLDTLNAVYMRFFYVNCLTKHGNVLAPCNSII